MSIRVLLREYPHRAIALVTPTHVLIFHHTPSTNDAIANGSLASVSRTSLDNVSAPRCVVEFADVSSVDLSDYRTLSPLPVHGTLGLITINNDVFLCVVTGAAKVASVRPGETVDKIYAVDFHCLNSSDYDNTFSDNLDPYSVEEQDVYGQNISRRDPLEHPCLELQKLLGNGSFYFSTDFDLTNRLQDRSTEATSLDIDNLDESFLWNSYMIGPLVKFRSRLVARDRQALDRSGILTSAIRGFVLTITIPSSSAPLRTIKTGLPSSLTLISRLSCRRAGTRFNSRGIDDDGNVANFVESESIYWSPSSAGEASVNEKAAGICFSYAQIRGSVPVFWEQAAGLIPGQQKITITRSAEGTQPAFDKHFGELEQNYGAVHVVNLLSETKPGEAELTNLYRYGVRHSALNHHPEDPNPRDHQLLRETEFDFHAETKGSNGYEAASMIRRLIENSADGFAYYLSEDVEDTPDDPQEKPHRRTVVVLQQEGVFRTNCLDCLDRTNLIQTIISQMAIEAFLGHRGERAASDFWMRHSSLWADNGDALSRIYAGTGALKSSFTRHGKMSLAGAIADARKSATRLYINNFADKGRQNTIDVLLGRMVGQTPVHLFDPINDFVTTELNKRSSEFQSSQNINIYAGTFNLNGRTSGIDQDLSSWLCPELQASQQQPEIVAVGFQEIVELSPQQIMNSDPTRKQAWEKAVRKTLNRHARAVGSEHYVLLRSGQLVGAALCIFVQASVLQHIKNVEGSVKKTGMSGMAGNKGAVAIRMEYANTQICFVTAHLAAGFANYEERNRDYNTIHHGLRFQRNRGIDDHDTVIWIGDFNYRIGLGSDKVRQLIKVGDLETLYENDQLNLQMVAGLTFPYYSESRITFNPTYKYDLGNDTYDSSEKARIPAWTDRILRKGTNLRQINYNIAPLRFSDHRPVYATFQCTVSIVDEGVREALSRDIYERRRLDVRSASTRSRSRTAAAANTRTRTRTEETDDEDEGEDEDEDLTGYDPIEPGLPPASSDKRKWWLDNGRPARSRIRAPAGAGGKVESVPNPKRPSNPYSVTDEADWVSVSRVPSASGPGGRSGVGNRVLRAPPFDDGGSKMAEVKIGRRAGGDIRPQQQQMGTDRERRESSSTISSAAASNNSNKRAPPPPVARKPVHLTSSPTLPSSSVAVISDPRAGSAVVDRGASPSVPLPLPRRAGGGGRVVNGKVKGEDGDGDGDGVDDRRGNRPGLPPRPRVVRDLLGDDDDDDGGGGGLSGWEVLRPG